MTKEDAQARWLALCVESVGSDAGALLMGLWEIRPTFRAGWWQVTETSKVGRWSSTLPFEVALMLWAGIRTHWEEQGESPLMPPWGTERHPSFSE